MVTEYFVLGAALLLIALIFVPTLTTGSSPVPTSASVRRALLALLPIRLPGAPSGLVYELGSGWGGMAFALAKKYPDTTVIGYEISPVPWLFSRIRLLFFRQKNLQLKFANFQNQNLSDASLVLCYLLPGPMEKLRPKLESELMAGALVVSNSFAFRGWSALDDKMSNDMYNSHVYLYEAGNTKEPEPLDIF